MKFTGKVSGRPRGSIYIIENLFTQFWKSTANLHTKETTKARKTTQVKVRYPNVFYIDIAERQNL